VRTPFPNAFTIHRYGLFPSRPFPLSVAAAPRPGGVTLLELFPMRLVDVADRIAARAQDTILVHDVDHGTMERLDAVARAAGLGHVPYRPNAVALPRGSLLPLVERLSHWEFHFLDLPGPPAPEAVERSRLDHEPRVIAEAAFPDPDFPRARIALHSHDDCFLTIHSADDALLRAVFARALEIYAGTVLGEEDPASRDVAPVPPDVIARLWTPPLALTFLREDASREAEGAVLGFSRTECSLLEKREYPLAGRLRYEPASRAWALEDGRQAR